MTGKGDGTVFVSSWGQDDLDVRHTRWSVSFNNKRVCFIELPGNKQETIDQAYRLACHMFNGVNEV